MKKTYEKYSRKFISTEVGIKIGKFWRVTGDISFSLIYFDKNVKRVYDSIGYKVFDVKDLEKYANLIRKEIGKYKDKFYKGREKIGGIYFWVFEPKYKIKSIIINIVSPREKKKTFIFVSPRENYYTISARKQEGEADLPSLLGRLIEGFKDAGSGGHLRAAGGFFLKKDLKRFKERLRELK